MDKDFAEEQYKSSLPAFGLPKIYPYIKKFIPSVLLMVVGIAITTLGDVLWPLFTKFVIDEYIPGNRLETLPWFVAAFIAVLLVQTCATIMWCTISCRNEVYVARDLKRKGFHHLQKLSFSYFNQNAVGYIHARVVSDTSRIGEMISWGVVDFTYASIYLTGLLISMFILEWRLAIIILIAIPLIFAVSIFFEKKLVRANRKIRELNSHITGAFNEGITGAKTTKTLVAEEKMERGFFKQTADMRLQSVRKARLNAAFICIITTMAYVAIALVLWYGGGMAMKPDAAGLLLKVGTLSVFTTYSLDLANQLRSLASVVAELVGIGVNIERFTKLVETEPNVKDSDEVVAKYGDMYEPKTENWETLHGDIEFCDVTFKYPDGDEYILEHFNLKVPAETKVAIVGETGAGKSTLVNLVCRFFEPTEGKILIDGRDYRERSQLWLHSNLGYVLQTPHLFSGTVRENLTYGAPDISEEQIWTAVKSVGAEEVITKLEKGLDTEVGEGGDSLSTGEKQLLSFARAILADPRLFVLDEATSSVDTMTEKAIEHATDTILKGRTSFIIAHRLSTIRSADIILVVANGKIVERGTHDELLHAGGAYFNLYMKQFEEENLAEAAKKM